MHKFFSSMLFLVSLAVIQSYCAPLNTFAESPTQSKPIPAAATASFLTASPTQTQAQLLADETDIYLPTVTNQVADPKPALAVTKTTTSSGPYELNNSITYSIVAKNTGNITLTGVIITDPGAVLGACSPANPTSLNPGKSITCSATHTVTQADITRGSFTNIATADSNQTAPVNDNAIVTFSQNPVGFIADDRVISEFDSIPESAINAAGAKKLLFYHASTGGNIMSLGFKCLNGQNSDPGYYPDCILPANPSQYSIANWGWLPWPSGNSGDALGRAAQFSELAIDNQQNYDIIGMKFCYLDGWNLDFDDYRTKMEALENQYPNKVFIWATPALYGNASACGGDWNPCEKIANFNVAMRAYALTNNKPLYDISSIESDGGQCQVGGYEGLCAKYYDGLGGGGGGHPDPDGSIRLAKGFWWLMAKLSGWN